MNNSELAAQKQEGLPLDKKYRYIVIGILLGLCLFYLFRSCSVETVPESDYHIGQENRLQGLFLMGKERNLFAFNKDLLTAIAKQEHFHIHFLSNPPNPMEDLEEGKLQGILTTLQPNSLNERDFLFSHPYFSAGFVLIVPTTSPDGGWNEKRKKIVGISPQSPLLFNFEHDPSIQIKFYDDILPALADLRERRIDGAVFPLIPAYTYVSAFYKDELKIATQPLTDEGLRLITLKNPAGETLIKKFNEGLEKVKQDGTYEEILERWGFINIEQIIKQPSK